MQMRRHGRAACIQFAAKVGELAAGVFQARIRVASKLAKLASVRAELPYVRKEAGRWQNLNASSCQFFRRRVGGRGCFAEFELFS
jgi:hypothetical protein